MRREGGRKMETLEERKGQAWRRRKRHEKKGRGKGLRLSSIYASAQQGKKTT